MIRRILLATIIIEIPLQVDINLDYHEEVAALGGVAGLNVSLTTLCLAVLFMIELCQPGARRASSVRSVLHSCPAACFYFAIATISMFAASDIKLAVFDFCLLLQAYLLFVYVVSFVRTRQDVLFIVTMLLIGFALQAAVMVSILGVGHSIEVGSISADIREGGRLAGTVGSPNGAGSFLALLSAVALGVLLAQPRPSLNRLALIGFCLAIPALVFTLSRGSWIAFFVSASYLFVSAWLLGKLRLAVPVTVALVLFLCAVLFHGKLVERVMGDDRGSAYSRIPLNKIAFRIIEESPILGVGLNNYIRELEHYGNQMPFRSIWLYSVHNKYLLVWAETGIFGILVFVWFLFSIMRRGWQAGKSNDRFLAAIALGLSAGVAGHMVHMSFDTFRGRTPVQMLWLFAGLIIAVNLMEKEARRNLAASLAINPSSSSDGLEAVGP